MKVLLKGARQIVQVVNGGERFLTGENMKNISIIETKGSGLSLVINKKGCIHDFGEDEVMAAKYQGTAFEQIFDVTNMCIIPGLVDAHTHPVWDGDRVHEFAMKLAGATYMEVHKAGGGINFTVEHTRAASDDKLYGLLESRLKRMLSAGTTTVECKSGYGLDVETEIKMLRVLERAKNNLDIEISSTFLGGHSVPKGQTSGEATESIIKEQIPEVARLNKSGALNVENIDVFCEKGVFSVEQTRRILQAGQDVGLQINFHGEELSQLGSAEMGAKEFRARAISHLEEVSDEGISAMAESGTVAVILPTTAYILRLKSPPARKMIEAGVIVALGTDFNPNAFCLSMPLVMHLAAVNQRMSLNEALAAATINSAHSIGRSATHGSIEKDKVADLVIVDAPKWEHLIYQFGGHDQLIRYVFKKGKMVCNREVAFPKESSL